MKKRMRKNSGEIRGKGRRGMVRIENNNMT
jgi:hypothetical protein